MLVRVSNVKRFYIMVSVPKSMRLQIGLFGRMNVGKSSFLNMLSNQKVAITSPYAGTTTDVVEKAMELLPIGPVTLLDTAGIDDNSELGYLRKEKTGQIFARVDVAVLLVEAGIFGPFEKEIVKLVNDKKVPLLIAVNKTDQKMPTPAFLEEIGHYSAHVMLCSCFIVEEREKQVNDFKALLQKLVLQKERAIVHDLLPKGGLAVLIVPIDLEAPKGRLILPQVQTIRDILDGSGSILVVKESEYIDVLKKLKEPPDLVICDSQVVGFMVKNTPVAVPCTTFSILFSRFKGDLTENARGLAAIALLKNQDRILIAEACSHHPLKDDIGREKIPRWLKEYTGLDLQIDVSSGRDAFEDIQRYKLIIHCGACMLTRNEMLRRIAEMKQKGVAMTNYGLCISYLQGVLPRVLSLFPEALEAVYE